MSIIWSRENNAEVDMPSANKPANNPINSPSFHGDWAVFNSHSHSHVVKRYDSGALT